MSLILRHRRQIYLFIYIPDISMILSPILLTIAFKEKIRKQFDVTLRLSLLNGCSSGSLGDLSPGTLCPTRSLFKKVF